MYHRVWFSLFAIAALFLSTLPATPVHAANAPANCSASPGSGPAGTAFNITCSGFTPNAQLWAYVVLPTGRVTALVDIGDPSLVPGRLKANGAGVVTFRWLSDLNGNSAQHIGTYTWVVEELAPGGKIAVHGEVQVTVSNTFFLVSGATLAISPTSGPYQTVFSVTGSGFAPNEIVNTWITLPFSCSTYQGVIPGPDAKANGAGNIAFTFMHPGINFSFPGSFTFPECDGTYTLTARALGSGHSANADFSLFGNPFSSSGAAALLASPGAISLNQTVTLVASGFQPGERVDLWLTEPDGAVHYLDGIVGIYNNATGQNTGFIAFLASGRFSLNARADAGGTATFTFTPVTDFFVFTGDEPGIWRATARGNTSKLTATTTFIVNGLVPDP